MIGEFIHSDCMKGMKEYEDNHFDLAIVDPPFGIGKYWMKNKQTYKYGKDKNWNEKIPDWQYFNEIFRVSVNQIIFGGNYYAGYLPTTNAWLFWDKGVAFETNLSMGQLAWTSFNHSMRYKKWLWSGAITNGTRNGFHPCEMPIGLYKWLLKNYAKEGDLILDTHVGSASSLIACEDMGFKYVGFELDEDYYKAASKRLQQYINQLKLF